MENEYLVAKINADTVEIWPPKVRIYFDIPASFCQSTPQSFISIDTVIRLLIHLLHSTPRLVQTKEMLGHFETNASTPKRSRTLKKQPPSRILCTSGVYVMHLRARARILHDCYFNIKYLCGRTDAAMRNYARAKL